MTLRDEPIAPTTAMPAAMIKNEPRKIRNRDEVDTQFEFMAWRCLVRKSPDTPGSVLLRNALACRDDSYATKKCLRPLRSFRRTRLSRVGVEVLAIADSFFLGSKLNRGGSESSFLRDAETKSPRRPLPNQLRARAVAAEWDAPVLSDS